MPGKRTRSLRRSATVLGGASLLLLGLRACAPLGNGLGIDQSSRVEVPANVDGLKTAQLAYTAAFGAPLACGSRAEAEVWLAQRPRHHAEPAQRLWRWIWDSPFVVPRRDWETVPYRACFDVVGWSPDGGVRGAYWVEVEATGERVDFVVHGIGDMDGDGVQSHWTATPTRNAQTTTPNTVR